MEQGINLLPKSLQRQRRRGLYWKSFDRFLWRLVVGLALLIVAEIVIIISYQNLLRMTGTRGALFEENSEVLQTQVTALNQLARETKLDLQSQIIWSTRVQDVRAQTGGVTLTELKVADDNEALLLRGRATERAAVTRIQGNLEQLEWVQSIEAPLENFTVGPTSEFSLKLIFKSDL